MIITPVLPSQGVLRPLGLGEVRITGGFWAQRQQVNGDATIDHGLQWMQKMGWIGNFGLGPEERGAVDRGGREFADSEVYKLVEAMCWDAARAPRDGVASHIAELTQLIATAQAPDGYLHTAFGGPRQRPRYSDLDWGHELYCMGHLMQAAVAASRTSASDELVAAARLAADHVCTAFGPDANPGICGHPEIEVGLAELARVTGEQRYLDQAAIFLERRGRRTLQPHQLGWAYFSDDIPIREASVLRGHVVRALYLACGAVDVAVETGDRELLETVAAQFDRTLARRTYITGGMGAHHFGESFGDDFVLPPDRAYAETCGGVAAIMLAWRLLLATGERRYSDVIERVLYNVVATAIGDDGRSFFYANTLHQRALPPLPPTDHEELVVAGGQRAPWREVSCCLGNIARILASLPAYLATVDSSGLQIHQYADAEISTRLPDGRDVGLTISTGYPDQGTVQLRVTRAGAGPWALALRVPGWAQGTTVTVNGSPHPAGEPITREFAAGDLITLELPMRPRLTFPDPRIDAIRGCVAVEQGPQVMCAESPGAEVDLDSVRVDVNAEITAEPSTQDGVVVHGHLETPRESPWPYAPGGPPGPRTPLTVPLMPLVPYHRWARRGPSTMRIWLPTA